MAPKAREVNMAVKNAVEKDDVQRKRPTGADTKPGRSAQPRQMSQAEAAVAEKVLRKFEGNFVDHENCVAYLADHQGVQHFWLFKDGSAVSSIDFCEDILPRKEALQYLPELLTCYYTDWVEFGESQEFMLWIARNDGFRGTAKEAFETILWSLDPPADPSKKALSTIECETAYMQSLHIEDQAGDHFEKLYKTAERLVASGLIEARSMRKMMHSASSIFRVVRTARARLEREDLDQSSEQAA